MAESACVMVFSSHVDQPPAKLESGGRPRPRTEQRRCVAAGSGTPGWERWNAELCFTPPDGLGSRCQSRTAIHRKTPPWKTHAGRLGANCGECPPNLWPDGGAHDNIVFWFPNPQQRRKEGEGGGFEGGGWSLESLQVVGSTPGTGGGLDHRVPGVLLQCFLWVFDSAESSRWVLASNRD